MQVRGLAPRVARGLMWALLGFAGAPDILFNQSTGQPASSGLCVCVGGGGGTRLALTTEFAHSIKPVRRAGLIRYRYWRVASVAVLYAVATVTTINMASAPARVAFWRSLPRCLLMRPDQCDRPYQCD